MLTALERKAVGVPDAKYSAATKALASEASELLGYKPLEEDVFKAVGLSTGIRPIKAVFEEHEIEPFDPQRVAAYKRKKAWRANWRTKILQALTRESVIMPAILGFIAGAIVSVACIAACIMQHFRHRPMPLHSLLWLVPTTLVLYSLVHLAFSRDGLRLEVFSWKLEELKKYKKPVPEFAIARAVELKRALPEADFYVDELAGGTYVTLDPFMVVAYEGTLYYIDVWNEPEFEGRRTK